MKNIIPITFSRYVVTFVKIYQRFNPNIIDHYHNIYIEHYTKQKLGEILRF